MALDYADYKPEGTLFIIPVRLEECEPPRRLRMWQYADIFEGLNEKGVARLLVSLKQQAEKKNLYSTDVLYAEKEKKLFRAFEDVGLKRHKLTFSDGIEFMFISRGEFIMGSDNGFDDETPKHVVDIPYDYWMARFPVTNKLYDVFVRENRIKHFVAAGGGKDDHPVSNVMWTDAMAYCKWLNNLNKIKLPDNMVFRLPTEAEWEKAARGVDGREYPWGNEFDENRCNTRESNKSSTVPVDSYSPQGDSPYGCSDMSGNVCEWTLSLLKIYPYNFNDGRENEKSFNDRVQRGGSFFSAKNHVRCSVRTDDFITDFNETVGFRICLAPPLPK